MIALDTKLIILSGSPVALKRHVEHETSLRIQIIPTDEKAIAHVCAMMRLVRSTRSDLLCFACKSIGLQRYQFVLKSLLLLGKARRRLIVDESGERVVVTWPQYVFVDIPRFVWETVASIGELFLAFIRLELLRQTIRERRGGQP